MEALVIHAPGDLRVEDVPTPPSSDAGQLRVRVRAGGICGSDLHYFQHGGFGTVRIQEPMVLGHEVAGVIEAVGRRGRAASRPASASPISPSRPCGAVPLSASRDCRTIAWTCATTAARCACRTCRARSASRSWSTPSQAYLLADGVSDGEGAMAEPLVGRAARRRSAPGRCSARRCSSPAAGRSARCSSSPRGARARRTSSPPTSARSRLRKALKVGADEAINVAEQPDGARALHRRQGQLRRAVRGQRQRARAARRVRRVAPARHHRAGRARAAR